MSYLVTVTLDIEKGDTDDYDCVYEGLADIGLRKTVSSDNGGQHQVPTTTTVGTFDGKSAGDVRDDISVKVEAVFKSCGLSGQAFVAVGGNWAWAIRYPKLSAAHV